MELCGGRDVRQQVPMIYIGQYIFGTNIPQPKVIYLGMMDCKCNQCKPEALMFKCICQECGEEFECDDAEGRVCDDCLEEAEDEEYEDSEYEE